jgi:hypothetical protein
MAASPKTVLDAVARRLAEDPEHVLPTLRLLADPDAVAEPGDTETLINARRLSARRLGERWEFLKSHSYTTSQARALLGDVSRQAVASRVANGTLMAKEIGGRLYFPDWQFGPDGVVTGLGQVLAALTRDLRGVLGADAIMRTALPEEGGRTPAQLLFEGDVDRALHYIWSASEAN